MSKTVPVKKDNEILNNIFHLIKVKGVRQKDLADYLGISHNTITQWKLCRTSSYMNYIDQLATFFGVTPEEILIPNKNLLHESLLTPDEMEIVNYYRHLKDEELKNSLMKIMETMVAYVDLRETQKLTS